MEHRRRAPSSFQSYEFQQDAPWQQDEAWQQGGGMCPFGAPPPFGGFAPHPMSLSDPSLPGAATPHNSRMGTPALHPAAAAQMPRSVSFPSDAFMQQHGALTSGHQFLG